MTVRVVTDVLPEYPNTTVTFYRRGGSFTMDEAYPPRQQSVTTDENGAYSVELWPNTDGLSETSYLAVYPGKEAIPFVLEAGDTPITMAELRAAESIDWASILTPAALSTERARYANTTSDALGAALIGFRTDDSGAARTVRSKLAEAVSLLDFIPETEHAAIRAETTTTDFADSFAAAFDYAESSGRYNLWLPPGLYPSSPTVRLPSNLVMFGPGATIKPLSVGTSPFFTNENYETSGYNENITIDGVTFDGDDTNQSLLIFRNTTTIRLLNCTFIGAGSNGLAFGLSGLLNNDVLLLGCTFKDCIGGGSNLLTNTLTSDGVYLKGINIRVLGCTFENCNDTPLVFESVLHGIALGNVIRNDTSGMGIMGNGIAVGLNCRDITIAENDISGVRYYGIYCHRLSGSFNEHISISRNKIRSHMATTTLSAAATNASTSLSVHDAAGLVEISQAPNFIIDDTGTPRIFYSGEITDTTVAITQAPAAYTASIGNTIGNWSRTSTITVAATTASTTITMADTSVILAKPGDFVYIVDNTSIRRWMYVTAVTATTLTVAQTTPSFTAGAGNIVTNYYGVHRTTTGATTTVTEASTSMLVENPDVLQLQAGQTFYIVDNTGTSRALVCVSVSGLTITFTQSNSAYTASAGNVVRSFGEHLIATTTLITEGSTSVTVASTLEMDIEPGKVVHVRDNTGTLRALTVSSVTATTINFTQTNSAFTASIGNTLRIVYGGNTGRHSIYVDTSAYVDIDWNHCSGAYESGVRVIDSAHVMIERNRLIDYAGNGISVTGSLQDGSVSYDVQVLRNYVERCTTDPIASYRGIFVTNSRTVLCDGNTLRRNQGGGVYLQTVLGGSASWNTIDDTVSRRSGTGITLLYGCQDLMLAYNDINNTIRWGIDLDRNSSLYSMSNITLSHNKIRSSTLHAIRGQNVAGVKLDHNDITNGGESGVRLINCTGISLAGDKIQTCQAGGVAITSPSGTGVLETDLVMARDLEILNNGQSSPGTYSGFTVTTKATATACTVILDNITAMDTQTVKTQTYGVLIDSSIDRFEYSDLHVRSNRNGGLSNAALNVPTIAAGSGAGTGPTVSVSGTDRQMLITVVTGTTPATNATVVTVTYATAFGSAPRVMQLTPAAQTAAALSGTSAVFINSATAAAGSFVITSGPAALAASTTYRWYVEVKE